MSLLPGMPEIKLPTINIGGLNLNGLYGADALQENASSKAMADRLARGRFQDPKSDKKDPVTGERTANFAEQLTELFGGPKFSEVAGQANALGRQQEATKSIQTYKDEKGLDFSSMSPEDRKDPEKVRVFATKQLAQRDSEAAGITPVGDTTAEIITHQKKGEAKRSDEILENSLQWQTLRGDRKQDLAIEAAVRKRGDLVSDRNFGLQVQQMQNQNNQALATLNATLAQAKMSDAQQTLDREYLDRRDLRDYNYRIKQDDQERMDDIFKLLLGVANNSF